MLMKFKPKGTLQGEDTLCSPQTLWAGDVAEDGGDLAFSVVGTDRMSLERRAEVTFAIDRADLVEEMFDGLDDSEAVRCLDAIRHDDRLTAVVLAILEERTDVRDAVLGKLLAHFDGLPLESRAAFLTAALPDNAGCLTAGETADVVRSLLLRDEDDGLAALEALHPADRGHLENLARHGTWHAPEAEQQPAAEPTPTTEDAGAAETVTPPSPPPAPRKVLLAPLVAALPDVRAHHPRMLALFRDGDDYVVLQRDAETLAAACGLPVRWEAGVLSCQFPAADLERHLRALLKASKRVAIIDQAAA